MATSADPSRAPGPVGAAELATGLLLLEGPGLIPPPPERQVRRWLEIQLRRAAGDALLERLEVDREDVPDALEAALHEEAVLGGPEAGEIEHERLVAPGVDVVRRGVELVGE